MRLPLVLTLAFGFTACDYNYVKDKSLQRSGPIDARAVAQPDFQTVMSAVIGPKCLACHAAATGNQGSTNLETFAAVRAKLPRLEFRSLEKRDMPPSDRALSPQQFELFKNWIENGAPEIVAGIGEKPEAGLETGAADWPKVRDRVLGRKCASCHQQPNPEKGIDLTDLNEVRKNVTAIFETIYSKRSMPPAPLGELSKAERRVLFQWIDLGMPQ